MLDSIFKLIFGDSSNSSKTSGNKSQSSGIFGNKSRSSNRCLYKLVQFEQAKDMIERNQTVLIDVRTPNEFEIMHIKNAINIPVDEIEKKIFSYELDKSIMVYCSSGARSKTAIQILNSLGYNNIYIWEYSSLATFPYKQMLVYRKSE